VPVPRLILASASPARRNLLAAAGIDAEVMVSGVDESTVDSSTPELLCLTLARLKAEAVAARLTRIGNPGDALVLGCDSVLDFAGQVFGKPADVDEARQRWRAMRGRAGVLHTGHCLIRLAESKRADRVASTVVRFAEVTDEEIEAYVGTGEPLHVAGAFTIDGRGGVFVESIEGDHGNVIGLSLPTLRRLLTEFGIGLTELWTTR
jgi:septum formation protein